MSRTVLVDSNVYIHLLRSGSDPVKILGEWIGSGDLVACGMVRMEVERGLKVQAVRESLGRFFDVMIQVPTTTRIWKSATTLAWTLDRRGKILPAQDVLIAASATSVGAAVLTDDAHFAEIPGCSCLDPASELAEEWKR